MSEEILPCPFCGKSVKVVDNHIFYENCDCYAEDIITPEEWNSLWWAKELKAKEEKIAELEKENRGLRSVVTACSKEPMPDWSKRIWDLNEDVKEKDERIKKLEGAGMAMDSLLKRILIGESITQELFQQIIMASTQFLLLDPKVGE